MSTLVTSAGTIQLTDHTLFHLEDLYQSYETYIQKLLILDPKHLQYFLKTLRTREIIENQKVEGQNSFLIELYQSSHRANSIAEMIKILQTKSSISVKDFKHLHAIIIRGSEADREENYDYRADDTRWVGSFDQYGKQSVDYFPPQHAEVINDIQFTLDYFNQKSNDLFENIFLKPLIAHLLIAYIQPFGDGNTRTARLLQHGGIWRETNDHFRIDLSSPALYLSENYLLTRKQYRDTIKLVVTDPNIENWNKWFQYNLNMFDDQLFRLHHDLDRYTTSLER